MVKLSDLEVKLKVCQQLTFKRFNSVNGFPCLNELCEIFCDRADEYLKASNFNNNSTFLCLAQVITCIKNLEKILNAEEMFEVILSTSRQHFIDRILWCLTKLYSSLSDIETSDIDDLDSNFLEIMDDALNFIAPYTVSTTTEMFPSRQSFA